MHSEANRILASRYPELEGNLQYGIDHAIAFCEIVDDVPRVLGLKRWGLAGFFDLFDERLAEPARLIFELDGHAPDVMLFTLQTLEELLEKSGSYEWGRREDWPGPTRQEALDREATLAFQRMLTGWLPPEAIDVKVAWLGRLLASSRALVAARRPRLK
jgi:hypothetical protein